MLNRHLLLLYVLVNLVAPGITSSSMPARAETPTGGVEIPERGCIGIETRSMLDLHRGCAPTYDDPASDTLFVPRGAAAGAGRATRFGSNWQRASLDETVGRIAGPNPIVETTASGKQIFRNPDTGLQVVYDTAGNYFRVENPGVQGVGRYLDLFGNEIPANVPLVGPRGTTQTGVPRDVRNGLTHFLNVD